MNREEIIAAVKSYTNMDTDEITTVCQNHIDSIQDNDICGVHDFSFLTDFAEINTSAVYTTGTANLTQDSTSVVCSGSSFVDTVHKGWTVKFNSDKEYYEITDIVNGTQTLTLSSAYIGESDTDATYKAYKIYYALPSDFKKMISAKQLVSPSKLSPIREMVMQEYYPNEFSHSGEIRGYILSGLDASNIPQIRFYPIQTKRNRVYLTYVKKLPSINSTGAISKIPADKHILFVYKLSEIIFDMHSMPNRANKEIIKFQAMLQQFIKEDKQKTKDNIDIMQSHFLSTTMAMPRLNPDHYNN